MESTVQDLFESIQDTEDVSQIVVDTFYVTEDTVPVDYYEERSYAELPVEHYAPSDEEEDFDRAKVAISVRNSHSAFRDNTKDQYTPLLSKRPEVIEDFVKNFLVEERMVKTLAIFQTEWHQTSQNGRIRSPKMLLPDCYTHNRDMAKLLEKQSIQLQKQRDACISAGESLVRLRKERDFHRMHHNRLGQEKQKLLHDLDKVKRNCSNYPETITHLKERYDAVVREHTLVSLERDSVKSQVTALEATLQSLHIDTENVQTSPSTRAGSILGDVSLPGIDNVELASDFQNGDASLSLLHTTKNPFAGKEYAPCGHLTKTVGFHLTKTVESHYYGISDVSFHPNTTVLVTGSDDHTWKLWSIPELRFLMSGEGHDDWISSCRFHPSGHRLATGSGDNSIKIWDFTEGSCIQNLNEHTHGIWSISWHWSGNFLASGSQDHHIRIWDVEAGKCLSTMREHSKVVTCVQFLPYSQLLISSSADKRAALWDARNGLCVHLYTGHTQSVNWCCSDLKGIKVASCDSFGQVNFWDLRQSILNESVYLGPHMANRVEFDSGGACLGIAMANGVVKMYNLAQRTLSELNEHDESVQCLAFEDNSEFLISGCSDGKLYLWS